MKNFRHSVITFFTVLLCLNSTGLFAQFTQQGSKLVGTGSGSLAQQGSKLVGTGNTGAANQGASVALSSDGNTALVGATNDNSNQGAVWVFYTSAVLPVELFLSKRQPFDMANRE